MAAYLGNALSLGMLDFLDEPLCTGHLEVVKIPLENAKIFVECHQPASCVGHVDTALLFSSLLGIKVECNRVSTSLKRGDVILVGQYNGPRLPEGATSLPEGAKIRWMLVRILRQEETERVYNYI